MTRTASGKKRGLSPIYVQMLGPLAIHREGRALELPASRKVRALLAYLIFGGVIFAQPAMN